MWMFWDLWEPDEVDAERWVPSWLLLDTSEDDVADIVAGKICHAPESWEWDEVRRVQRADYMRDYRSEHRDLLQRHEQARRERIRIELARAKMEQEMRARAEEASLKEARWRRRAHRQAALAAQRQTPRTPPAEQDPYAYILLEHYSRGGEQYELRKYEDGLDLLVRTKEGWVRAADRDLPERLFKEGAR